MLFVRSQLIDSHRVNMQRNYIEYFGETFGEHAISSQQILHNTKGNETMVHFLRIK